MKTKIKLFLSAFIVLIFGWQIEIIGQSKTAPNIVILVADDLGYGELGAQGNTEIPTPNIDSIAAGGARFTNGYVSAPVCAPRRAGLLSGRYQQRFGFELNPGPGVNEEIYGLPTSEKTIAERLKPHGYATGIFGKWHLGFKPELQPTRRGFDEFFGFLAGQHSYFEVGTGRNAMLRGTKPVTAINYTTEDFTSESIAFVERNRSKPFLLYVPFNAVHTPMQATQKYLARFEKIENRRRRNFAAMLSAMDDSVGRILSKLRELKLEENTIIFFISDNGGPTAGNTAKNTPLRGFKAQVWEGGIRVPFMMQWKGKIPAGKVYEKPVIALDILPTIVAAATDKEISDKLDGVNLLPYLTGKKTAVLHEQLFWRFGEQKAIRTGDWKLVDDGDGAWQLFNLAADIGETKNTATANPDKVKQLQKAFETWNAQLKPPLWKRETGRNQADDDN